MKLLINADDLGYTPIINQTILKLYNQNRLSSSSLLANMPYSLDAIERLQNYPNLNIGGHLNLTKGRPLQPRKQVPSLANSSGNFWSVKQLFARVAGGLINFDEVERELRTQINYLLDCKTQLTHLDSHSHWHLLPSFREQIFRLAESYEIYGIRQAAPRRTLIPSRFWLAAAARSKSKSSRPSYAVQTPDYLLSLHLWMGSDGKPVDLFFSEQLRELISNSDITLELVTHPGELYDSNFPADTLLPHQRQWEVDFLLSSRFDEWLEIMDAEIINHQTLSAM